MNYRYQMKVLLNVVSLLKLFRSEIDPKKSFTVGYPFETSPQCNETNGMMVVSSFIV